MVEIVHGSTVTIQTLYSLVYSITIGILKRRVQIVEIVHGSAVTIKAALSGVILHVPDGIYGIILGNIHRNHWKFGHLVSAKDCIISPICEYYFKGSEFPDGARFQIQVPHIIKDIHRVIKKIRVAHLQRGVFSHAKPFTPMQYPGEVYYKLRKGHVEIFSPHFCQFIITAKEINCCSESAVMLAFSKMEWNESGPVAKAALYFGSIHYAWDEYRQVLSFRYIPFLYEVQKFVLSICLRSKISHGYYC